MQSGSTPEVKDYFYDLDTPSIPQMELELQQLVQQGVLSPEAAKAALADESAYNNISLDPRLQQNQMASLSALQEIADSGGMTAMDRANLNKIESQENAAARGQREAILQNAQARGMGGSGLELMSQMQNQQNSATRKSQRDMEIAGLAQQRALEAIMQQGNLAGNIQNQSFNQQAQVAGANDAISRFNAQNQQQTNLANTQTRNDAAARNLAAKQQIADSNVGLKNQQQVHNKNLVQQNYENEIKKRQGQSGIAQNNANAQGQNSQNQANANNQNIGTAASVAAMFMSDENVKENIEPFDPSAFLDSLTGFKFNYKNPEHGVGRKAGVMAQDLLKSEEGAQIVEKTPEGLAVDSTEATGPILASLASINDRLKRIEGGK